MGVTLIWSDEVLTKEIDRYQTTQQWSTHRWLHLLLGWGTPVFSVARIEDLDQVHGPILAINYDLFSPREQTRLFAYRNGPVAVIGEKASFPAAAVFELEDAGTGTCLVCGIFNRNKKIECPPKTLPASSMTHAGLAEPPYFPNDLAYRPVAEQFIKASAEILLQCVEGIRLEGIFSGYARGLKQEMKAVGIWGLKVSPQTLRLLIRNDNYICVAATVDLGRTIEKIRWLNPFTAARVEPQGSRFTVKVPGRGTTVLDIELTGQS
jgi:hypothetical protein